jgi:arsenate reductase
MEARMLEIYGIPTCGTVKKAISWLQAQGLSYQFIDFRQKPPSKEQVSSWVQILGNKALRNTSGQSYRALPAEKESWDDARWIEAFAADPMLIRRPVVVQSGQVLQAGWTAPPTL